MSQPRIVTNYTQSLNQSQTKSQEEKRKGLTIAPKPVNPEHVEIQAKVVK